MGLDFTVGKVFFALKRTYAPAAKYYILNRKYYRFVYILSGSATYLYKDFEQKISQNSILFLLPQDDHLVKVTGTQNFSFITVAFSTLDPLPADIGLIHIFQNPQLKSMFEQILAAYELKSDGWYPYIMSRIYSILYQVLVSETKQTENEYIKDIQNYIKANYQRKLTLEELADQYGFSLTHFKRVFKAETGTTPIAYLNQFRIERAKDFLRSEMFSIREVAGLCGFENEYYFSTAFKKAVGVSPRQYRSENT